MEEEEGTMIEEREELMIPPNKGGLPTLRKAHFLKPILVPTNQHLPKLLSHNFPIISNINLIKKRINFHGVSNPLKSWKTWVDSLQKTHQETWKKVGIFDAIKASTYNIITQKELIIKLAENWCPATNTFFFPWGECTITLEDVMILGGLSVQGSSARSQFRLTEGGEIQKKLIHTGVLTRKKSSTWMNYFIGKGGEIEHVALIVLWLSRYIFIENSKTMISTSVFSLAVSLIRGTRIALAPAVLASIYRDLTLLKQKIVSCKCEGKDGDSSSSMLVLCANLQLVQVWAWERFPTLSPKPVSLAHGEPRVARWHEIKMSKSRISRPELEPIGDGFLWRPYVLPLNNWEFPKFYCDHEMWVLVNAEVGEEFLSFAMCLRACNLVGIDCVEKYFPQRVAMQFGLDQDIIPFCLPCSSVVSELVWNSYEKPLDGLKFYIPPRLFEADVTLKYSEWWRMSLFVHDARHCEDHDNRNRSFLSLFDRSEMPKENSSCCNMKNEHNAMGVKCIERCNDDVLTSSSSNFERNAMERDKEQEVNESDINTGEGTRPQDEKGEAKEDAQTQQVNFSHENLVIVMSDEEDKGVCDAFEVQCHAFDARISRLESLVSVVQAAKLKSKASLILSRYTGQ